MLAPSRIKVVPWCANGAAWAAPETELGATKTALKGLLPTAKEDSLWILKGVVRGVWWIERPRGERDRGSPPNTTGDTQYYIFWRNRTANAEGRWEKSWEQLLAISTRLWMDKEADEGEIVGASPEWGSAAAPPKGAVPRAY